MIKEPDLIDIQFEFYNNVFGDSSETSEEKRERIMKPIPVEKMTINEIMGEV